MSDDQPFMCRPVLAQGVLTPLKENSLPKMGEREREREREVYSDDIADTKIHSDTQLDTNKNSFAWFRLHWF